MMSPKSNIFLNTGGDKRRKTMKADTPNSSRNR